MALASRTLEASCPRPWSWVSSSWSWPWPQTISPWPSPWVPSPWSWPWAISHWPWPRPWTVSPWPCPQYCLEHSNFLATNPAPACILTSVKKYLDFIPMQSCSVGSVDSWKAVEQEGDFHLLHHLMEKSSAAQPPQCWCSATVDYSCAHIVPEWEIGCSQILYC